MKDSLDFLQNYCEEVPDDTISEPEFVAHDALNILRTDVICHHGILGMKWGIRRYQNKDGSLTAAGRKRYYRFPNDTGDLGNILTDKGRKAFKNRKGEWKTNTAGQAAKARHEENQEIQRKRNEEIEKKLIPLFKKSEKYRKEVDFLSEDKRNHSKDPKILKRIDEAADLGLRALEAKDYPSRLSDKEYLKTLANAPLEKTTIIEGMGYGDGYPMERLVKSTKDWFTWEDQTIGYSQMADLVNQGYSKEKVKDMRDCLKAVPPKGEDDMDNIGFEMDYVDDKFIDACYLIKEAQKKSK
jgi:hypothetical protein